MPTKLEAYIKCKYIPRVHTAHQSHINKSVNSSHCTCIKPNFQGLYKAFLN